MIFVCLGTQKFQCNRLLKEIDSLVYNAVLEEEVFAQIGNSDYIPLYYNYIDFLDKHKFEEKIRQCTLLITHSGVGTIIAAMNYQKPIIVYPRLKKFKEHVDNHQLEIANAFSKNGQVLVCHEKENLIEVIMQSRTFHFIQYESQRGNMITTIQNYLKEEFGYV